MGSSLERFVVVSGERVPTSLLEPLGVAAWVFVCLNHESEYKLHCAVLLKIPRSMEEILMIHRRRNHNRIDSLSRRISKLAETPTGEGTKFFLNPPTETVRHQHVLSCLPPVPNREVKRTYETRRVRFR